MYKRLFSFLDDISEKSWWWILVSIGDLFLSLIIIHFVSYTEIDWVAYMQEVEGPLLHNEYDYMKLRGDTGPLVYPAGFVYVFMFLRYVTNGGTDIKRAQYIFAFLHSLTVFFVLGSIYYVNESDKRVKTRKKLSFWVGVLAVISRRVHSIYALRLFNDGVAMVILYFSVFLLVRERWTLGCFFFSFAFSIKMNIILFAPGLAVVLLQTGGLKATVLRGLMCLLMQVGLAIPFLMANPAGYVERAFELGRVFMFKWTVNFKFLPEEIFVSPQLALGLVIATLITWTAFGHKHFAAINTYGLFGLLKDSVLHPNKILVQSKTASLPRHIIWSLFTSNFIGVVFARSIHYQFYSWYFHTLGFLVSTSMNLILGTVLIVLIEICYNIYPATPHSSLLLQTSHIILLVALWFCKSPIPQLTKKSKKI